MAFLSSIRIWLIVLTVTYAGFSKYQEFNQTKSLKDEIERITIERDNFQTVNQSLETVNTANLATVDELKSHIAQLNELSVVQQRDYKRLQQNSIAVQQALDNVEQAHEQTKAFYRCEHDSDVNSLLNKTVTASNKNSHTD